MFFSKKPLHLDGSVSQRQTDPTTRFRTIVLLSIPYFIIIHICCISARVARFLLVGADNTMACPTLIIVSGCARRRIIFALIAITLPVTENVPDDYVSVRDKTRIQSVGSSLLFILTTKIITNSICETEGAVYHYYTIHIKKDNLF